MLEQLRTVWNQGRYMVLFGGIWNDVLEDGTAEKIWKQREKMVHSDAIWNGVLEVGTA